MSDAENMPYELPPPIFPAVWTLALTQRILGLAIDHLPLALMVTDARGTIEYSNPALHRLTGYAADELAGQPSSMLRSDQMPSEIFAAMWQTLESGRSWEGEFLNRRKDGELVRMRMFIEPIDEVGEPRHYLAVEQRSMLRGGGDLRYDPLTGLPTEAGLVSALDTAIESARLDASGLSIAFVDLDRFREINDGLGAEIADRILLAVCSRMQDSVRQHDIVARIAGDRFAIVLTGEAPEVPALQAMDRLRESLAAAFDLDGRQLVITCSIGVARFPEDGEDAATLLANAGAARLKAKEEGGNRCRQFEPAMGEVVAGRVDLARQLRVAVKAREFVLHYQPQLSLHSGEIVGFEALVRWQHPQRGLLMPGQFIALAEETGSIVPMSEWIVHEACRQAKEWLDAGFVFERIAVNLSARHFRYSNLPEMIAGILHATGLPARQLELELTETVMMYDVASAMRTVDRLKALGLRLALDDFGTGYSSLAYLSRFAIDMLKLDQSFVRDITSNPVNASIAVATIAMAHKLGKNVIAEGVETEGQMSYLRRHECDEMQGYLFSRPLPAAEITAMLREGRKLAVSGEEGQESAETLLLVDDEPNIVSALKRLFRREGYVVLTANSGAEGLALMSTHNVQVVVSDQRMPEMSGTEFLSRVKDLYPKTVRLILSGYSELATVTDAINRGAIYKFLTKPWDDDELRDLVRQAFRKQRESN